MVKVGLLLGFPLGSVLEFAKNREECGEVDIKPPTWSCVGGGVVEKCQEGVNEFFCPQLGQGFCDRMICLPH